MEIDLPEVLAEVEAAFARDEAALIGNDVAVLDEIFRDSPRTIRYGPGESPYGRAGILAFRRARPATGLDRRLSRTVITTFGRGLATASTEFHRPGVAKVGRQSQTWVRLADGWRVVAADVSFRDA